MIYDIYFHNDFDGRASAAVMLAFLRSRGDDIEKYIAMTYGKEQDWYKESFFKNGNPAIVVDFTYHPKATWWFDHHATTFKKAEWQKQFKPDKQHHLDPKYPSCCGLVYNALKKDFNWKPAKHFAAFVKSADIIDGARYHSAKETVQMTDPAIQMNSFIEGLLHTTHEDKLVIELMSKQPLKDVIRHPAIAKAIGRLKAKTKKSLVFYRKNIQVFKRSTFINLDRDPLRGLLRFAPYYCVPKSNFSFRMRPKWNLWYLGISANPWNLPKFKIDLGAIMKTYGGGGHAKVAAAEFPTKEAALEAFRKINIALNK
jgi:oligoribonuclease NrnB/cAMP/cGMP phosphodiesterase (DHH superfamily)